MKVVTVCTPCPDRPSRTADRAEAVPALRSGGGDGGNQRTTVVFCLWRAYHTGNLPRLAVTALAEVIAWRTRSTLHAAPC